MPPAGIAVTSSAFALAMFSIEPRSSMCTSQTFVTMPIEGAAIGASAAICPIPRIPISTTAAVSSGVMPSRVSGRPTSLL